MNSSREKNQKQNQKKQTKNQTTNNKKINIILPPVTKATEEKLQAEAWEIAELHKAKSGEGSRKSLSKRLLLHQALRHTNTIRKKNSHLMKQQNKFINFNSEISMKKTEFHKAVTFWL